MSLKITIYKITFSTKNHFEEHSVIKFKKPSYIIFELKYGVNSHSMFRHICPKANLCLVLITEFSSIHCMNIYLTFVYCE